MHARDSLLTGGESGPAVVAHDVDSSYLLDMIRPINGQAEMPKGEPPLTEAQIQTLEQWIAQGATWPENFVLEAPPLWSLQPLRAPEIPAPPTAPDHFVIRNPIDAFVAARLSDEGLQPAVEADRRTLIRRLSLDLTGLPPEQHQVETFVNSSSPDAYEAVVDQLLASPHFGEHWGRYWLDLARYADSEGYLGDSERPHAWVFREWVINAINTDLPFDQFTVEQLAGDLLPEATRDQKIATGFHRNTLRNTEAGVDLELYRTKEIVDRVNTTGMVWLGLTLGCAECHDHKHDPITQKEFYQFYAFFNNADDVGVTAVQPWEVDEYQQQLQAWQPGHETLLAELQTFAVEPLTSDQQTQVTDILTKYRKATDLNPLDKFFRTQDTAWKSMRDRLQKSLDQRPAQPATKARAFAERTKDRRETYVHVRGVYNRPGEQVTPGTLAVLPAIDSRSGTPDRFDLARWLFKQDNPLTGRVAANRVWQQLFGQGIVSTPNDFGTKGAEPTHPQLLDFLATEYRRLNWSRKALIRLIVTSSTYRMSSAWNAVPGQNSAGNLWLWRQNSFRVPAETVRDLHLTASGLLDRTIGRKGIRPPLPEFVTEVGRSVKWPVSQGSERYRRGMYIFFKRTVPYPMLITFDAPDATVSCSRRERSNTPLQALTLLNDPVFYECAQTLGREAAAQFPENASEAIQTIFTRCLGRPPADAELASLTAAFEDLWQLKQTEFQAESPSTGSDHNPRQAALTAVARIVMNLDEFITRN